MRHSIEETLNKRTLKTSNRLQSDLQSDMKIDEKLTDVATDSESQDQTHSFQQRYKTSSTLMACYDSGGQPEFFDVMPAFISATKGNIMIFDVSKNLNLPPNPEFYKDGEHWESSFKTHYTAAQLLKTALANIQWFAIKRPSCSTASGYLGSSRLLLVGNHLDQCGGTEDEVHKTLYKMEKIIRDDVLCDCSSISVIKRDKEKITKVIHPIASKCDKETKETTGCKGSRSRNSYSHRKYVRK